MNMEQWRVIPNFYGLYEVSNQGRVRRRETQRVLGEKKHPGGYVFVCLSNAAIRKQRTIHSLVAETFMGPRPSGLEVNHRNGIKNDNRLENLEYVTHIENERHKREVLGKTNAGINHGAAKLTFSQVEEIRRLRSGGLRLLEIAAMFNCSFQHISDISHGKRRAAA